MMSASARTRAAATSYGRTVTAGKTGTLVVSFRIVPFSEKDAAKMIAETRVALTVQTP